MCVYVTIDNVWTFAFTLPERMYILHFEHIHTAAYILPCCTINLNVETWCRSISFRNRCTPRRCATKTCIMRLPVGSVDTRRRHVLIGDRLTATHQRLTRVTHWIDRHVDVSRRRRKYMSSKHTTRIQNQNRNVLTKLF